MSLRHTLALVTVLVLGTGCFGSHRADREPAGTADAGGSAALDGGASFIEDAGRRTPPIPGPGPEPPPICSELEPDVVLTPTVLLDGEPLTASMRESEAVGCGCVPRYDPNPDGYDMALCDCCEACDCIDNGYDITFTDEIPGAPGDAREVRIGGETRTVHFRNREQCAPRAPLGLEVIAPPAGFVREGPATWWAVVRGEEFTCCVEPQPAVAVRWSGSTAELELLSCTFDPCDCDCGPDLPGCAPTPFEAYVPLGELDDTRSYSIRAGPHMFYVNDG